jgi:tRNA 2-selenouridine synthase
MRGHPESVTDLAAIFLQEAPLLDVRAPIEFAEGAFPGSVNLPLLTDSERQAVGLRYREQGPTAALRLGETLVSGAVREARLQAWHAWALQHPHGYLYCFRGGLRSRTVQTWLAEQGRFLPRICGGYKAMRRFLLDLLQDEELPLPLVQISGRTGCGKTQILRQFHASIDLEELARHRGSAFGRRPGGQPTQIAFENALAVRLLQRHHAVRDGQMTYVLMEDESRLIGQRAIPETLFRRLRAAPRVVIQEPLETRVAWTLEAYVRTPWQEYREQSGDAAGFSQLEQHLLGSLERIRNRLGGALYQDLRRKLESALAQQARYGHLESHADWIAPLLTVYYDPLYDYGQTRQRGNSPIWHVGSREEVRDYLQDRLGVR